MNNFNVIFETIKNHCNEPEVKNDTCFYELESILAAKKTLLPADYYLSVLHGLELIKYCAKTKEISLTEKGNQQEKLFGASQ